MSSRVKELETSRTVSHAASRGTLFVVSSPSGGGTGTIIRHVLDVVENLRYSVSYTTRAPRLGEVDGREYFFVNRETFEEMVAAREFLEWACVHGNLYGTAKNQIIEDTAAGADIKKLKKEFEQSIEKVRYLTPSGRVDHDALEASIREALDGVETKVLF